MSLKLITFIVAIVFIVGSLLLAIWYRIYEENKE